MGCTAFLLNDGGLQRLISKGITGSSACPYFSCGLMLRSQPLPMIRVDFGSSKNPVPVIITNGEHRTSATAGCTELFVAQSISRLAPVSGATGVVWSRWKRVSPMSGSVGAAGVLFANLVDCKNPIVRTSPVPYRVWPTVGQNGRGAE